MGAAVMTPPPFACVSNVCASSSAFECVLL